MSNQTKKIKNLKILFFGDLVGRPGRFGVRDYLAELREAQALPDFVIANCENASHGFGLTQSNYNQLLEYGIDCLTSGNHIWDKKDIFSYIDGADKLVRPFNYPAGVPGVGSRVFEVANGNQPPVKIAVINILGQTFMPPINSPWQGAAEEIRRLKEITPVVIVDFHAEATAEKVCFAKHCIDLGVSAFFGTHTHVQTADERIMGIASGQPDSEEAENSSSAKMAYITDAGFCGAAEGVIGMDYRTSITRFTKCLPERYEVENSRPCVVNAVEVEIDAATGHALAIKRIFVNTDK
jgi:metallophosphoesterase (TIGR00282 family)